MVKISVVFICHALKCHLAVIVYFVYQFCNAHIFSHKYAIPHFVSPIDRVVLSNIRIWVSVVIDGVSGVGAGGEGSGAPFNKGGEGDTDGGGDDVCELDVGLCNEVGDRFYSSSMRFLPFLPPAPGMRETGSSPQTAPSGWRLKFHICCHR